MKSRKSELSWLNVLFCLLVILIHVLSNSVTTLDPTSWQYLVVMLTQTCAKAAVPGFFFLSGLKLCLNPPSNYKQYYLRKLKTILIPYLVAVTVYYLTYVKLGWYPFRIGLLLKFFYNGRVGSHFYFIVCLVQFIILAPLWIGCVKKFHPVFVLPAAVLLSIFSQKYLNDIVYLAFPNVDFLGSDRIFTTYFSFFISGCYIGHSYPQAQAIMRQNQRVIIGGFAGSTAVLLLAFAMSTKIGIPGLNEMLYFYEFFCILFLLLMAQHFHTSPRIVRLLDQISYPIYLYHMIVVVLYTTFMPKTSNMGLDLLLRALVVYIVSISLCIIWHFGVSKIKTCGKDIVK